MKVKLLISSIPFHPWKTSASQVRWNLIALEQDELFLHVNSHGGWWKLMMVEGALLWLTFSCSRHSSNQIEVVEEGFHEVSSVIKCCSECQFHVNQWILNGAMFITIYCLWEARCLIDHSLDIQWSIQSQLTFQQLGHGRTRTRWGDVPRSIDDDGDGFFPGQRHAAVSAILLLRLNVVHQQSLNAANITITSVPTYQDRSWSSIVSFEDIWNIYATPISSDSFRCWFWCLSFISRMTGICLNGLK